MVCVLTRKSAFCGDTEVVVVVFQCACGFTYKPKKKVALYIQAFGNSSTQVPSALILH